MIFHFMYIPHSVYSFICQWTLGCFHLLIFMNMLLWTWIYRYLFASLLSDLLVISPEVLLLNHMVILTLTFRGTNILFSVVAASFYILIISAQGSQLLCILTNTCYFCDFDSSHSNGCVSFIFERYFCWV